MPFPPLISVDEACAAIAAAQRDRRPRRRLMSVAAAAAVATLGLTGVAVAAGNAQPGDPLWGVSTVLDGSRARSVEAAYLVNNALVTAQQALAEGRVADARVALSSVDPDLDKVADPDRKGELASRARNLHEAAEEAKDGERVPTDEHGAPSDPQWPRHRGPRAADPGGSNGDPANGSSRRATPHQQSERPNPGELFVPTKPGSPGGGAEQKPDAPANPGATNPGTANPADPGASKPGFPGFPGRPGQSPGATGDPRAARLGGDGRRDQLTKPPSAGNTANSQGCARSNAGHPNGCANPAPSGR